MGGFAVIVRKALVERVKDRAKAGHALFDFDVPQELSLLTEWRRLEGRDAVQRHLSQVFRKQPQKVSEFLKAVAPRVWIMGDSLVHVGKIEPEHLKSFEFFYDLDELAGVIRQHCVGNFERPQMSHDPGTSIERQLAEQFMHSYSGHVPRGSGTAGTKADDKPESGGTA